MTAATITWELDGPNGRETWVGPPGAYDHVSLRGEAISLHPRDGELPRLRARGAACLHPGPWPYAFHYCPECGTPLLPAPPVPPPPPAHWSGTATGTATGLPHPASHGTPDAAGRGELPMPGPARLDWFIAGTPARLFALDQNTGRLHAWTDGPGGTLDGGAWHPLAQTDSGVHLPRWSSATAAFPQGAALATDTGPVFVTLGPRQARPVPAPPALGITRSLGGAAGLAGTALVPVAGASGPALARWTTGAPGWTLLPLPGAPSGAPENEMFAAPSVNATEAFWPGLHGLLHARLQGGDLVCAWRPWRDSWNPMLAVRPVLSPGGVFHQMGRAEGQQSFEALLPPGATPQRRPFDRYVTSAGSVTFLGAARHREPWEPRRQEYRADGNAFLLPLLPFDRDHALIAACTPRTALRSFIETRPDAPDPVECRIMFAGASIVPTDLRMTIRARSAGEITALVYRRTLLVYDATRNCCCTWPLLDA